MKKYKFKNILILLIVFQFIILSTIGIYSENKENDKTTILFLTSCNKKTWINFEEEIRGIYDESDDRVYLKNESINNLDGNIENEKKLYNLLKQSLDIYNKFNFIISSGEATTKFCIKYREELFDDIPIIFLGVEDKEIINEALQQNKMSGIGRRKPIEENIELIKKYHKNVDTINLIGNNISKKYRDTTIKYKEFEFNYIDTNSLTKKEVEDILSKLDKNDALIQLSVDSFKDNTTLSKQQINKFIYQSNSNIPIYSTFSTDIGYGSIGGKVKSPRIEAQQLIKIGEELLEGKDNKKVYINNYGLNRYMFDYNYLSKFGISERDLPDDVIILNSPIKFLEEHRGIALALSISFIILIFLVVGLLLYIHNYVEYKKAILAAMRKTEDIEKLKRYLLYNITHELRTPINVITSAVQLNKIKCLENDNLKENINNLEVIEDNCNRLLRLINNIVDIQKIEENRNILQLSSVNIVELVENIVTSIVPYAKSKNLNLIFDTEEEEVYINVDVDKIERVILNLISNAIKFSKRTGDIKVNLKFEKDLYIIVEDEGIGIEKDKINDIFGLFTQLDNTLSRQNEGSGIGLSVVKYFVELHKGTITVDSKFGEGAKFIVKLPINEGVTETEEVDINNIAKKVRMELSDIYL